MDADLQDVLKFWFMIWLLTVSTIWFWKKETLRFCCAKICLLNYLIGRQKHLVWNWMISIVAWKPTKIVVKKTSKFRVKCTVTFLYC
jgi:hypothetical protein